MLAIGKLSAASVDYYTEQLSHSVGEDVPVLRGVNGQVDVLAGGQRGSLLVANKIPCVFYVLPPPVVRWVSR